MSIRFDIYPSHQLLAFILLTHVGAILCLLVLSLQWWGIILIEISICGSFIYNVSQYIVRKFSKAIVTVWIDENKKWFLLLRSGKLLSAELLGDSMRNRFLMTLHFKISMGEEKGKKYSVVILPDSVSSENYRRLYMLINSQKRS